MRKILAWAALLALLALPASATVDLQLRSEKGSYSDPTKALTGAEVDANYTTIQNTLNALITGAWGVATAVKTGNYTAAAGDLVLTDTSGGPFTVTLPATPVHGNMLALVDLTSSWGTNNITIARNGSSIDGAASNQALTGGRLRIYVYSSTGSTWRTVSQIVGTDVQASNAVLTALAALTNAADKGIKFDGSSTASTYDLTAAGLALLDDGNAAAQRTTLGLGTIATQAASSVTITGGAVTGITDIAVADGGTGSSTASGARTNLGVAIGSDVQAYSANTTALAAVASNGALTRTSAGAYSARTITAGSGISVTNGDGVSGNPTIASTAPPTIMTVSSDRTFTSTTPAGVTGLSFSATTLHSFDILCALFLQSAAITTGPHVAIVRPTSDNAYEIRTTNTTAANTVSTDAVSECMTKGSATTGTAGCIFTDTPTASSDFLMTIRGGIRPNSGGGTWSIEMATEVNLSTITVKEGSYCVATDLGAT
jgi:hypothetical protein